MELSLMAACQAWRKPRHHAGFCTRGLCLPTGLLPGESETAFHGTSLICTGQGEFLEASATQVGLFLVPKARADVPPIVLSIAMDCGEGKGLGCPSSPEVLDDHPRTLKEQWTPMENHLECSR